MMDIPLDEVIYFDGISSSSTGAAADSDSTPTFAVYEESTDTDIGVGGNMTKRTSLTGNYRGSFTASAANGFEVGKWYSVIGSATIGGVACKGILKTFRVVAAEVIAGKPKVDVDALLGTAWLAPGTAGTPDVNVKLISDDATAANNAESFFDGTGYSGTNNVMPTVTTLTNLPAISSNWLTAAGLATDAVNELRDAVTGGAWPLSTDSLGRIRVVDGTGAGELDTASGVVLAKDHAGANLATAASIAALNNLSQAQAQTAAEAALVVHRLDELLNADSDIDGAAPPTVGSVFHELMTKTAGSFTFDQTTDSLEALRDRGDAGWTTATGFSTHSAADVWAVATRILTAATNITSTGGTTVPQTGDAYAIVNSGTHGNSALKTLIDAVKADTAAILLDTGTDGVVVNAAGLATDAVQEIRNAITGGAYALNTSATGSVRVVDGTGTDEINTSGGDVSVLAASVRSAVGLASANLDTQLDALPTATENATGLLDLADAIEVGLTLRNALRLAASADAGKLSGAATATVVIRNAVADSKNRITATVDASGNRSAITYDLSA